MSPENLNVPVSGMGSDDIIEDDVIDEDVNDDEIDEESLIMIAEDPDNESTV